MQESWDGRTLFYSLEPEAGIRRRSLSDRRDDEVIHTPVGWQSWAVGRQGIYYAFSEGKRCRSDGSSDSQSTIET